MELHITEVTSDSSILAGTPVFRGTRVPFDALVEYLGAGDSIDDFVRDFPTVTRDQARRALLEAFSAMDQLALAHKQ